MKHFPHRERLEKAATIDEVVAAVGDYVQALSTDDVQRLPRHNRPGRIDGPEAIHRWADQLARYESPLSQDPVNHALFIAMRDCFVRASQRVGDLSGSTAPRE